MLQRAPGCRTVAATAAAVLLLAGCADTASDPPSNSSVNQPIAGTFEEAALVALGELFRIYGTDAAPAPLEVTGEIVTHDGQKVWRLDGTYEVARDNQRTPHQWTLWIGPTADDPLAVLDTDGPG